MVRLGESPALLTRIWGGGSVGHERVRVCLGAGVVASGGGHVGGRVLAAVGRCVHGCSRLRAAGGAGTGVVAAAVVDVGGGGGGAGGGGGGAGGGVGETAARVQELLVGCCRRVSATSQPVN